MKCISLKAKIYLETQHFTVKSLIYLFVSDVDKSTAVKSHDRNADIMIIIKKYYIVKYNYQN